MISSCSKNGERNVEKCEIYNSLVEQFIRHFKLMVTSPFTSAFSKSSIFGDRKRGYCVDGWQNRRKKDAFSNLSGLVWTGPKRRVETGSNNYRTGIFRYSDYPSPPPPPPPPPHTHTVAAHYGTSGRLR